MTRAAGDPWITACPDWAERIRAGRSLIPDLPLNREQASKAMQVFDYMCLPDVPGKPMLADAAGDWFRDIVRTLFGAFDPATGKRHLSEVFVLVPKKNSKTTYSAALMLTAMFRSARPRAEFLLVAPTIEVADLAFAQAVGMIEADPVLLAKCHIQGHLKRIAYRTTGSFLKIKSFDPKVVTGSKPAGVLLDEIHVIAEQHDADRVIGQLRGGLISQPEGFLMQITTQSERPPSGVFAAELRKARAVRDGKLIAPILPVLYEFPPGVDWRDPANWGMVLPNAGRSISVERLRSDFASAEAAGPQELLRWLSQHLDVEIGTAAAYGGWAGSAFWSVCGTEPALTLEALLRRCDVIELGVDGGGLDDMLGLVVLGREIDTGRWLSWEHAWLHPIALERRKENAALYRDFAAQGHLTICSEPGQDVREVAEIAEQCHASGLLDKVGVDPVGIGAVLDELAAVGIPEDNIVGVSQGWRLTGAIKTVERRVADRALAHAGTPLMAWCVSNAKVEPRGNAVMVTKQASGTGKIDPLMALFNAASLLAMNPQAQGSFWQAAA